MTKQIKSRGFTIVELLIVIVVIAILAAITIVAYNGIQNRAKTSAGQSLANTVLKKAEAYNTIESAYPANVAGFGTGNGTTGNPREAKLDDPTQVVDYAASGTGAVATVGNYNDNKKVIYRNVTGGSCIWYWDFAATTPAQKLVLVGAATSALCTA